LGFEHITQPTFGFLVDTAYESEDFRNPFFRYALAGDDLKATCPAGRPVAPANVSAVESDRNRRSGFRRGFDVALAAAIVHELFRSDFRLEPISGRHDVLTHGFWVQAGIDRQHILEKFRHCRKRRMGSPFRQQKIQLRSGMRCQEITQGAVRRLG